MSVSQHILAVNNKKVDLHSMTKTVLDECQEMNNEFHFFNNISREKALKDSKHEKKGKLAGVFVSVKDCLCVKDVESTAGSDILRGYHPPFSATAVKKVEEEGAIIIGKTSQDEFGFGGFSVNMGKGFQMPLNPLDKTRSCGGSSGGSAGVAKRASFPHLAIAESTGGSIVCPASFCGVVGLCPTYGRISRWGLIDYANSLDKIGSIAKTVDDAGLLIEVMSGYDEKDSTSANIEPFFLSDVKKGIKGLKIGIIKEAFGEGVDPAVAQSVKEGIKVLERKGAVVSEVSLPVCYEYGISCYYLIAMCEASTNLAKYCGMRYGAVESLEGDFNSYFSKVRTAHFGDEAKRRLMIGTFARMAGYRDAYYLRALKVRGKIIEEYKEAFKKVDVLISPTMPMVSPKFEDIKKLTPLQNYMADILTVSHNLAGLPHMSVPVKPVSGMPVGLQLISDYFNEAVLIQAGRELE